MDFKRIEIDPKEFSSDQILETYQRLNEIDWSREDDDFYYIWLDKTGYDLEDLEEDENWDEE